MVVESVVECCMLYVVLSVVECWGCCELWRVWKWLRKIVLPWWEKGVSCVLLYSYTFLYWNDILLDFSQLISHYISHLVTTLPLHLNISIQHYYLMKRLLIIISVSIEENELVGNAFDEYGVKLKEDGDFGSLGDLFVSLASFHQSIEALRLQMVFSSQYLFLCPLNIFCRTHHSKLKFQHPSMTLCTLKFVTQGY